MLRKGSAGSNTAADHIAIVDASVAALPSPWRRKLMVTVDGAGFSHKLVEPWMPSIFDRPQDHDHY